MNGRKRQRHSVDMLFSLVVFLMFTFSAVAVLVLAINFYRGTVTRSEENDSTRVAVAYVREVIHQNDIAGAISIDEFGGERCVAARQGENYVLYLYYYDGELKELYTKEGAQVAPADGQSIMALKDFSVEEITRDVLQIECEDFEGNCEEMIISIKSGRGGADDEKTGE